MKKLFLVPLTLLALLAVVVVSCEEEKNDDVCNSFEEINPLCEIPSFCCPIDVGNCYYVAPNGDEYKCDATQTSQENPNGCNAAMELYIAAHCGTSKMDQATHGKLVLELSNFTRQIMIKAQNYSVCH